jgi:hypothetical protein
LYEVYSAHIYINTDAHTNADAYIHIMPMTRLWYQHPRHADTNIVIMTGGVLEETLTPVVPFAHRTTTVIATVRDCGCW